jgi:dedicator of cytokinesis protein 3
MAKGILGIGGEQLSLQTLHYQLIPRFVVPPKLLSEITPDLRSPPPYTAPKLETQVIVGIFPAAIAHVRPGTSNDDGALSAAFEDAIREAQASYSNGGMDHDPAQPLRELAEVREEDEDKDGDSVAASKVEGVADVIDVTSSPKQTATDTPARPKRPKSLVLDGNQSLAHPTKPQPPVPVITAGDSTVAGQAWPLVDEIACAIREWHEVRLCIVNIADVAASVDLSCQSRIPSLRYCHATHRLPV